MITKIQFKNFKVLRDTTLPFGQFTLIIGPNGSGKSTVFKALECIFAYLEWFESHRQGYGFKECPVKYQDLLTVGQSGEVTVEVFWGDEVSLVLYGSAGRGVSVKLRGPGGGPIPSYQAQLEQKLKAVVSGVRIFSFDPRKIAEPVKLEPNASLGSDGSNLAAVLDGLRDRYPERFEALNQDLSRWLPEFDRVLFETPHSGTRAICLRTKTGGFRIPATDLSDGSLIALALLTLAYLPEPPSLICLEEPDHNLHPRLLRDVRDAIYRLAYPESVGEKRAPVQVIATTHNPYFLDLFREHPEEIVIAEKVGLEARFTRLTERTDLGEILGGAHLGDVWYSGILGGVPAGS